MGGVEVPDSWKGALNITYRYGGQLKDPGWYVQKSWNQISLSFLFLSLSSLSLFLFSGGWEWEYLQKMKGGKPTMFLGLSEEELNLVSVGLSEFVNGWNSFFVYVCLFSIFYPLLLRQVCVARKPSRRLGVWSDRSFEWNSGNERGVPSDGKPCSIKWVQKRLHVCSKVLLWFQFLKKPWEKRANYNMFILFKYCNRQMASTENDCVL